MKKKTFEAASYSVSAANHLSRSGNFSIALTLGKLFSPISRSLVQYFFLPFNVLTSVLTAIFSWRKSYLNGFKGHGLAKAILETATASAMCAAMIGSLAASSLFSVVSPSISAATVAAKALFNIGSSIYFVIMAFKSHTSVERMEWVRKAKTSLLDGVVGLVIATALVTLIVFASPVIKTLFQIICITGSVLAGIIALNRANDAIESLEQKTKLSTHAALSKPFGKEMLLSPNSTPKESNEIAKPSPTVRHCQFTLRPSSPLVHKQTLLR